MTLPGTMPITRPRGRTMLRRALALRCPHCGGGPAFVTWRRLLPSCPVCGLRFERGERGYWLGSYFFNLIAIETVFVVWMAAFLAATWPDPPWDFFQLGTAALMLVTPIAGFPFSRTLFVAFDLWVRPASPEDFAAPHEPARRRLLPGD